MTTSTSTSSSSHLSTSPIPANHFLNLPPSYSNSTPSSPSGVPSTSSHASNGHAPNVASLASADFEVDVRTGFLPGSKNVERLEGEYEIWEEGMDVARLGGLRLGGGEKEDLWRKGIESMPVLDTESLRSSQPMLRRAHLVLTFLLHFYVHFAPKTSTPRTQPLPIPTSISIPLLTICPLLGLPPVVTYSDTVLYNFLPLNPSLPPSLPHNPPTKALTTFTNTRSEEQFFVISALCEIAGAEALRLMRRSLDELFLADEKAIRRLTSYLKKLAVQIDRIGDITLSMIKEVDPEEFYHLIRPWFRGGDGDGPGSAGWRFMGADEEVGSAAENKADASEGKGKLFSGPSAGQSSLIHAIDIFLTVDHATDEAVAVQTAINPSQLPANVFNTDNTPITTGSESSSPSTPAKPNEATFVQRMLQYMPLAHRTFLLHLSTHPTPLRQLVLHHAKTHPKLAESYDSALDALKRFREKHMRVVSVFIIQQARRKPSERIARILGVEHEEEEVGGKGKAVDVGELRGTGGSPLFKFLKRCRDNTMRAKVNGSAGPVYDLEKGVDV